MTFSPAKLAKTATAQMMGSLDAILAKAQAHAGENGIDEAVLLGWRLTPDMFPMSRQVQIATELPARGLARLAGAELPSRPDTEASLAELRDRVVWARDFAAAIDDDAINADPDGIIEFPGGGKTMSLPRTAYLTTFILPNLYFHVSMAYGLLRACGVELGKIDYLRGGS